MIDDVRAASLLAMLRAAALEHWRHETGERRLDPATRTRFARRGRDCRSLARLGTPAREAVALAGPLAERLGLSIPPASTAERAFALEITAMLAAIYDELIVDADQPSGRK